jgi:hypothetical protein
VLRHSPRAVSPWPATGVRAATGGFPPAAGPVVEADASATEGRPGRGPMALDITLAVGDGARRMTYAELANVRGISLPSARRLVLHHRWPRQTGNDGVVRVTVPLTALWKRPETADFRDTTTPGSVTTTDPMTRDSASHVTDTMTFEPVGTTDTATARAVTMTDAMAVIGISTLSQAVDMLREDLAIANTLCFPSESGPGTPSASLRRSVSWSRTVASGSTSCRHC